MASICQKQVAHFSWGSECFFKDVVLCKEARQETKKYWNKEDICVHNDVVIRGKGNQDCCIRLLKQDNTSVEQKAVCVCGCVCVVYA